MNRDALRRDYFRWHHLQVGTGDIDPVYPVLRYLRDRLSLSDDDAVWLCVLHAAYYHLGSALAAFAAVPKPGWPSDERLLALPTGTERRGLRTPAKLGSHWAALLAAFEVHGGPHAWLTSGGTDWRSLNDTVAAVRFNGRWAAYKTAELAQKVVGVPTVVADAGHAHSSGPRHGLGLLQDVPTGNTPSVIRVLDRATRVLAYQLGESDIGQVETSLCDFRSLAHGGYYLGHDIDAMAAQLARVPSELSETAFDARVATFPFVYLAEYTGRPLAVDNARRRVYRDTGQILERR